MQLTLRRGFGYAFDPGRGMRGMGDLQSDLIAAGVDPADAALYAVSSSPTEGIAPSDPLITDESGVNCLASMFVNGQCPVAPGSNLPNPGFNINVTPGVALTPAELAAEQSRASAWLATIPGAISTAGKIAALTTAQIAAGVQSGALKPSSTCPSGYMLAGSAQCTGVSGAPLIPGVSNTALAFVAIAFLGLMLMGGKR
jgi:hypothetical protein